ncbi:GerAB/ArcD/ProY family transporter [Brevibacillus dissolubilis]|uniref:GerAB/ArcD/ProY family transporter n=1 Tax=Brevibacillus dissolubilis TaxID=1844116 RepID=UPI0011169C7C|nr:GerAB/ArcD/ProY family transporter [Brevibacillus dissolubilis]
MRTAQPKHISLIELFGFVIQTVIGIGVLSLPYTIFSESKTDAWISVLLAGFVSSINIWVILRLSRKFPSLHLYEYLPVLLGKYLSKIVTVGYILFFLSISYLILIIFGGTISKWVLPRTPPWAIYFLLVATSIYLARENLNVIARFCLLTSVIFPVLIGLMLVPLINSNFLYLFPIGQTEFESIINGARKTTFSIIGYELLLIIYPYVSGSDKNIIKVTYLSYLFVTIFYCFLVLTSVVFFSSGELGQIPEPILYMLKSFSFRVIERIDLLFLSIWIVAVITSFVNYLYAASVGMKHLFRQTDHKKAALFGGAVCFCLALYPLDPFVLKDINDYISKAALVFVSAVPFILLLISYFIKNRVDEKMSE